MIQRLPGAAPPSPEPPRGFGQLSVPLSLLSPPPIANGGGAAEVISDDTREDGSGGSTPIMTPGDAPMLYASRANVPYGVIARGSASSSRRPTSPSASAEFGDGYDSSQPPTPAPTPAAASYEDLSSPASDAIDAHGLARADGSSPSGSVSPSPTPKHVRWSDEFGLPLWDVRRRSRSARRLKSIELGHFANPFSPLPPRTRLSDSIFKQVALQPA